MRFPYCLFILLFGLQIPALSSAQSNRNTGISSFAEYGAAIHGGKNTPLWHTGNRHGLSSLDNYTYLRGGVFYTDTVRPCKWNAGIDMALASGFTSPVILQQAYVDMSYRWIKLSVGSREYTSPLLNARLSSGGLTWSGNARPIPQLCLGTSYIQLLPQLAVKAELSYGWFTDNNYQRKKAGEEHWYTKNIKYHHKSGFLRIGKPGGKWQFDVGMTLDVQFGGYKVGGFDEGDLGNSLKDYLRVFIPMRGEKDKPAGEQIAYQGNYVGSEMFRLTRRTETCTLSAYLENYFDDFSGMGRLNGFDGLWGLEYKANGKQLVSGWLLEYYQTTNQSGPMHGIDHSVVNKTGGADDYYNNVWYPGWVHWGMGMGNPLIASPAYNATGEMFFRYNRVKALHMGCCGDIARDWRYEVKLSYNRTWGTPFLPTLYILENFSTFVSFYYTSPQNKNWTVNASIAFDTGDIYGDNVGCHILVRKTF